MPQINLTLDSLIVPDITGYSQPFGTKVVRNNVNLGGLSTMEVNNNILMAFAKMRPTPIGASSDTTQVEYDAKLVFPLPLQNEEDASKTLTLGSGTYIGCTITISNVATVKNYVALGTGYPTLTMDANSMLTLVWNGKRWINTCVKVSTTAPVNPTSGDIWVE